MLPLLLLTLSAGPVIVIDPGHGGTQGGATGSGGLVEKELCLTISKKVKAQLEKELKATVVLTREKDALVAKLPHRPLLILASPWPIRSWFSSQRSPDRWLSTLALDAVSRKLTSVTTSTGMISSAKRGHGSAPGQ